MSELVSGYQFHKICKWSVCPRYPMNINTTQIQLNDTVFLNLDYFGQFIQLLQQSPPSKQFVLITHNSDQTFNETHLKLIQPYVTHIYPINCSIQHSLITHIPIGFVDDKYKPHSIFKRITQKNYEKNIFVYMNFVIDTNPMKRHECWNTFANKYWVTKQSGIPYEEFYTQLAKSKYVLSPEGTGIDCHRIYESIYFGAIPILKTSELDYFYINLPVIIVKSWNDITQEFLETNYSNNKQKLDEWVFQNSDWTEADYWIK